MRPTHRTRGKHPSTTRAPIDPFQVMRCQDLLAKGATVIPGPGDMVTLMLDGARAMATMPRTLKAARKQMAEDGAPTLPHSNLEAGEGVR